MKTFSAKSSAVRAAASHFKVTRNMVEVLKVATIHQNSSGEWFWQAICTGSPKKEVKPTAKPKATKKVAPKKVEVTDTKLQAQFQELSMGKLSIHYNAIAVQFGETIVTRFAHKKEAVKRTMTMHLKHLGNLPI